MNRWALPLAWVLLSVLSVLLLVIVSFVPSRDFPQWVFEAHVISTLMTTTPETSDMHDIYGMNWAPVPNLAANALMGAFGVQLSASDAGRLFLIITVLLFGYGFRYAARIVHQRPTAIEFLGFIWAYGLFMYNGFLSYQVSVPLALIAVAKLHQATNGATQQPRSIDLILITLVASVLYLAHLFGWLVFVVAVAAYALSLWRVGNSTAAVSVCAALIPQILMLGWYVLFWNEASYVDFYQNIPNKLMSLVTPVLLFLRLDPFPSLAPVFLLNLAFLAVTASILLWCWDRRPLPFQSAPLLVTAIALLVLALAIPVSSFAGLVRPDERFVLPALLLGIVNMRQRALTYRNLFASITLVTIVIGAHVLEYSRANAYLEKAHNISLETVSHSDRVLSLSVHEPPLQAACYEEFGPTIGVPVFEWFFLNHRLETQSYKANLFETAGLHSRFDMQVPLDLLTKEVTIDWLMTQPRPGSIYESDYPVIFVTGCDRELAAAKKSFAPEYETVRSGVGFAILKVPPNR